MRLRTMLSLAMVALSATLAQAQYIAYVGTYTDGSSKGIYAFRFDANTGKATPLGLAVESKSPSFLVPSPDNKHLYAVNEIDEYKGQKAGAVSAFSVGDNKAKLTQTGQQPSKGGGPTYISLDKSGQFAFVANYGGGSISVVPTNDGALAPVSQKIQYKGSSVNKERQSEPHAHCINPSPDGRFVVSADLGTDKVMIYRLDSATGKLIPNDPPFVKVEAGAGPRHVAFSPSGKYLYVASEMASTVTVFAWNSDKGSALELQTISTLPTGWTLAKSAAEIMVHPNGKFLYVSNRGRDSIALFDIDAESGKLTYKGDTPSGGQHPRFFTLDPTGNWLWSANMNTGDIFIMRVDPNTGKLTPKGEVLKVDKPVAVVFVKE